MRRASLGTKGLTVSAIGLGCMGMSQSYGKADLAESERTLRRAVELGIDFFDTADGYGWGHNEQLVGRVLGSIRHELKIATKFGMVRLPGGKRSVNGRPEYVRQACDASLSRLGMEVIDLYYLHRKDPQVEIEETVGAMAELVTAGKVRYLGLSEVSAATLRRACAVHPIAAVQSEYSLWTRDPESGVLPACRELGVGFVPFSPLGRAILTGRLVSTEGLDEQDMRRTMPRFQGENFEKNRELVARVSALAEQKGCTAGQLALAWLLAQGDDIAPIPGTKRVRYLEENAAAVDVVLSAQEVAHLSELMAPGVVSGARYAPEGMSLLDRD
ncbi:MAG: aldo/keto reductase [Nitrospinae bacterium]|nr:aldo/keto reductase [Nitrospinota bacterium]